MSHYFNTRSAKSLGTDPTLTYMNWVKLWKTCGPRIEFRTFWIWITIWLCHSVYNSLTLRLQTQIHNIIFTGLKGTSQGYILLARCYKYFPARIRKLCDYVFTVPTASLNRLLCEFYFQELFSPKRKKKLLCSRIFFYFLYVSILLEESI
jgi:hypothetical protein